MRLLPLCVTVVNATHFCKAENISSYSYTQNGLYEYLKCIITREAWLFPVSFVASPVSHLSLSCSVSPLSFLFFALSDMYQDSSDEDSGEEEDFAQVQFGSRYTAARCVLMRVCALASGTILLHVPVGPAGLQLTVHKHSRVKLGGKKTWQTIKVYCSVISS